MGELVHYLLLYAEYSIDENVGSAHRGLIVELYKLKLRPDLPFRDLGLS